MSKRNGLARKTSKKQGESFVEYLMSRNARPYTISVQCCVMSKAVVFGWLNFGIFLKKSIKRIYCDACCSHVDFCGTVDLLTALGRRCCAGSEPYRSCFPARYFKPSFMVSELTHARNRQQHTKSEFSGHLFTKNKLPVSVLTCLLLWLWAMLKSGNEPPYLFLVCLWFWACDLIA